MIKTLFPQLGAVIIDEVVDRGPLVCVQARTPPTAVACRRCGQPSQRVHAYHRRRLTDHPGRWPGVVVNFRCGGWSLGTSCRQRTFREQVPPLTQRWASAARNAAQPVSPR